MQENKKQKGKWIKPESGEASEKRKLEEKEVNMMKEQEVSGQYQSKCWKKLNCYSKEKIS